MKLVFPWAWGLSVWEDKDYSSILSVSFFFILGETDCQADSKHLSTNQALFLSRVRPPCIESFKAATHFFFYHIHEASV